MPLAWMKRSKIVPRTEMDAVGVLTSYEGLCATPVMKRNAPFTKSMVIDPLVLSGS